MSGTALPLDDFLDGWALWQEHRPQTAEDWVEVAKRCAADPTFDHTKSSPTFGAAVLLARVHGPYVHRAKKEAS